MLRQMVKFLILSVLMVQSTLLSSMKSEKNKYLTLANNSTAVYDLVPVGQLSLPESQAVVELADYLSRISGASFFIKKQPEDRPVIFIGQKSHPILQGEFAHLQTPHSFSIRTRLDDSGQRQLYLVGYDSTATAFAVYTWLEDLGCRWFMPGKIGEVIPQSTHLKWPVHERTEQPDFPFRQIWWAYGGPKETTADFEKWKLRNKIAYPPVKHGHNLTNTLPPEKYFASHPEYYALVNKERQPTQLCTSHPEVIRLVIEKINTYFDDHPGVLAYSLCPDDNTNFCECEKCRALDVGGVDKYISEKPVVTDRYIHFLNQVAQGIQSRHPGKKVSTYAYVNYSTPPIREKTDPNVVIVFTSSVYCAAHGIGDLHCTSRQEMKRDLAGWTTAASEVYIYDYDPIPYNAELPWPLFGARYREMSDYLAMGIKGFSFECHNSWATLAPNFYVAAKTMWNTRLDFDALMDDYMQHFFAESAPAMRSYYTVLENALAGVHEKVEWGQHAYTHIFSDNVLNECRQAIETARAKASTEVVKERVNAVALGFEYLESYLRLRRAAFKELDYSGYQKLRARCEEIIHQLYLKNKDYILQDVAIDYLNRGLGDVVTNRFARDLGLVTNWMLLGSFDNSENRGHDRSYPPEKAIDFAKEYTGVKDSKIQWKVHQNPEWIGKIDLLNIFEHVGSVCAYAATTVESSKAAKVWVRLGSNDSVKMWLNGKEVWNHKTGRWVALDDDVFPVTLPAGKSQILLKISNVGANWGFCFRITDEKGNPISDLKFSIN